MFCGRGEFDGGHEERLLDAVRKRDGVTDRSDKTYGRDALLHSLSEYDNISTQTCIDRWGVALARTLPYRLVDCQLQFVEVPHPLPADWTISAVCTVIIAGRPRSLEEVAKIQEKVNVGKKGESKRAANTDGDGVVEGKEEPVRSKCGAKADSRGKPIFETFLG